MKMILILLSVCMLSGCNMIKEEIPGADKIPMPSEIPMPSNMPIPTVTPSPAATDAPVALGTFITEILDTDPGRVHNLTLCASVLSGIQVGPGEAFSFNDTVGQRTQEKGYEEAAILVDGNREYAAGGGICQISSTLYNAAVDAGMEILERHTHTNEVHYVELGRDAAVSFGSQDFRFRNPLPHPVSMEISVKNTEVEATLYKTVTQM